VIAIFVGIMFELFQLSPVGGEFIIYAAISIFATYPERRATAAPAGLPEPVRLCEDLRIRHGQP
jgi:hypothetical protein